MTNTILKAAVHDLKRLSGTIAVEIGRRDLVITPPVERVIARLHELYARRASKAYGRFSKDTVNFPTEGFLRHYMATDATGGDFGVMTELMMSTLKAKAAAKSNAGTGHVFFAHVETDGKSSLLVAILNDKLGAALTEKYEVEDSTNLDLDGFRFAGRIGIDGWQRGDAHYISFLKGKGDVADYFREFLGCDEKERSKADTHDLVLALQSYATARGMSSAERTTFLKMARDICARSAGNPEGLDFTTLANELTPAAPDKLLDVLVDPERGLSNHMVPDLRVLGALVTYKAKTDLWSLTFNREALTKGDLVFDQKKSSLLIKRLPPELVQELQAEFGSRG